MAIRTPSGDEVDVPENQFFVIRRCQVVDFDSIWFGLGAPSDVRNYSASNAPGVSILCLTMPT